MPSRDAYYFDGECFRLKHPLFKKFRVGLAIGLAIGFFSFTSNNDSDKAAILDKIKLEAPSKDIALVSYISKFNKKDAQDIVSSTIKWANHFNLDPFLLFAIQKTESHFDTNALNPSGAMGIMQVLTKYHIDKMIKAKEVVGNPSPFDVDTNIFLGSWIIKDCINKFKSLESQLHCYGGATDKNSDYDDKVLANLRVIKEL